MSELDLNQRLAQQDELLAKIYKSVEKTRKYFLWTLIGTLVTFLIPLIVLIIVLPAFMSSYLGSYQSALEGL